MAERKAVNKYYPPDWDPKKGSLNTYHGQHYLRERARKLKTEGILIVRFEMPFNVWCEGCKQHIGKGVRYNAEKKHIGNYFSTKIWQFRMRCRMCSEWMEIHTDPKNSDFVCISGVKRKEETWKADESIGVIKLIDEDEAEKLATDPFYKLEHAHEDKRKAKDNIPSLRKLSDLQDEQWNDDYKANYLLRKTFRTKKKEQDKEKRKNEKRGIHIPLVPEDTRDIELAAQVCFDQQKATASEIEIRGIRRIQKESIFSNKRKAPNEALRSLLAKKKKTSLERTPLIRNVARFR